MNSENSAKDRLAMIIKAMKVDEEMPTVGQRKQTIATIVAAMPQEPRVAKTVPKRKLVYVDGLDG
jgi:hypothetical protein